MTLSIIKIESDVSTKWLPEMKKKHDEISRIAYFETAIA